MNAEHELEDSEISEMTQMVSALIEKGFSYEIVKQIYSDIGAVVLDALSNIRTAIANNASDPNKLKVIFGRALIEAYAKGDRDTLGLAQAFLVKAEKYLRENDIKDFTFPFSGATINPSFIATVSSKDNNIIDIYCADKEVPFHVQATKHTPEELLDYVWGKMDNEETI